MMLKLVPPPTESRATMQAYREGRSLEDFLNEMWARRQAEHPGTDKPVGKWPCLIYSKPENSNVHPMRKRGK